MNYQEKLTPEKSPLNRAVPGYDTEDALALMYEAALRKTFQSMEEGWRRNDDLQPLVVRLAENCFLSGIPEEEVVRRTIHRYYHSKQAGSRDDRQCVSGMQRLRQEKRADKRAISQYADRGVYEPSL